MQVHYFERIVQNYGVCVALGEVQSGEFKPLGHRAYETFTVLMKSLERN